MNGTSAAIFGVALLIILVLIALRTRSRPNYHHRRMMRAAHRAICKLAPIARTKPGVVIAYVRKMHPHAVEEFVLTAAQRAGHKVRRNQAYVGDGGIDGMIEIAGVWHLVQTKRYSSSIRPDHVRAFCEICRVKRMPGLFIHLGRTGPMSHQNRSDNVHFISGSRFAMLIAGDPITCRS